MPRSRPEVSREKSFLEKVEWLLRLMYSPVFELLEFKSAVKTIISRLVTKFIALAVLKYKCIKLRKEMDKVTTYKQYEHLGLILDKLQGKDIWKADEKSHIYDWQRIQQRLQNMRALRE